MKYKIWYSKNVKAEEAWSVKELEVERPKEWVTAKVVCFTTTVFERGEDGDTPQCWAVTEGTARETDGFTIIE